MTSSHLAASPALSPPRAETVAPRAPTLACAGLSDTPQSLRGELLTPERLVEHATELARAHGAAVFRGSPGRLRTRFVAARAQIRNAYQALTAQAAIPHDPSPAEEWLLDNVHIVEDQLREIEEDLPRSYLNELPRLSTGPLRGIPRTYALCLDYLRHTDARVDQATLVPYVAAYQKVTALTIGELWAVPIMLRIGLVLSVGGIAANEADATVRNRADRLAKELLSSSPDSHQLPPALARLNKQSVSAALLVQLIFRLREHESGPVGEWIAQQAAGLGLTADELTRQQHLKQAGDQVSVGNAITSMRAIGALDWNRFFERTSAVEAVLREDPAGAYALTDAASRDRYRHAVERLARRCDLDEKSVAQAAIELSRAASDGAIERHVGFYLVDDGRRALAHRVRYRPRPSERLRGGLLDHPTSAYLTIISALAVALLYLGVVLAWGGAGPVTLLLFAALLALPATEVSLTAINALITAVLPPRTLPKLDFRKGIPDEYATLVVVPSLLDHEAGIAKLIEDLEIRSLANGDAALSFALLTDFTDHHEERHRDDERLLRLAMDGIADLNRRHRADGPPRYFLFHRERRFNPSEGLWMGWERKRGKLEELNRLLRGATDTSFSVVTAPKELLSKVRFVITLDCDTTLPREVGRKLVSTIAHPLNRARFDAHGKVVRGYGLIQPRVGTRPNSSRASRFARIVSGQAGLDPYTTAVSDVYQDLFSEGSYVGKGIYDVDAFSRAVKDRVPENTLLSHDLFEGVHVRTALATDIEVLDDQPTSYAAFAGRQHRWVRGDWQLLPWLGSTVPHAREPSKPNELSAIARWRFLDNLRRSVLAPALIALIALGWLSGPRLTVIATVALLAVLFSPLLSWAALTLFRPAQLGAPSRFALLRANLPNNAMKSLLTVTFLLDQAGSMLDAIGRTLFRLYWSKRHLLEWTTLSEMERRVSKRGAGLRLAMAALIAAAALMAMALFARDTLPWSAPLLGLWALSPFLAKVLAQPIRPPDLARQLGEEDRRLFRRLARKTWSFFEAFVTEEDHWLPPDNFQQEPRPVVAHRTSPTNIGLYLMSTLAARDLGFITLRELADRWHDTLSTLDRLEKREGHLLNWYETTTLKPLEPQYISTVDSGNLAAYLWTMRQACTELADRPVVDPTACDAALEALRLSETPAEVKQVLGVEPAAIEAALSGGRALWAELPSAATALERLLAGLPRPAGGQDAAVGWPERVAATLRQTALELQTLAPWARWLSGAPPELTAGSLESAWAAVRARLTGLKTPRQIAAAMPGVLEAVDAMQRRLDPLSAHALDAYLGALRGELDRSHRACEALIEELDQLGAHATALADAMNFRFLYDDERSLFAIGYNVSASRLDGSCYDLLASEARLASLVAIAKGDAPLRHWFQLGRPRGRLDTGRVLLSWSGSMFEYLMPLLVTRCPDGTLLEESCNAAIDRQREYGRQREVPWGVSESAYNTMDLSMTYQYRAFGVPGLGLKAGLESDLVVAPYATVLASLLQPKRAAQNLRRLERRNLEGLYGLYESIDFTRSHLPPGKSAVVVKASFAHHQGMSLVSFANVLCDSAMQRRFHRDLRVRATELLLEERVPVEAPMVETRPQSGPPSAGNEPGPIVIEHAGLATVPLRLQVLGHGDLSTVVSATGTGFTTWQGKDLYRFREDLVEPSGLFVYLRDVDKGDCWSAGHEPLRRPPRRYDAAFSADRVELRRRDADIETLMEIVVSPEHPAEVRRLTLTNHGASARTLELTTYTEVVLAPRSADLAHRAFSGMFLHTERIADGVLVSRRDRSPSESQSHLVQLLTAETGEWREAGVETSRARFIGRGRTVRDPIGLAQPLSGTVGDVLDPIVALRRRVKIEPGKRACVSLTTALASSREAAHERATYFRSAHSISRTFELGWADARVELRHLGIDGAQAQRHQRLLSLMLFPRAELRPAPPLGALHGRTRDALWSQGISGDLPIVVLRLDHADFSALTQDLLLAHEFWRLNGIACDLVLLDDEPASYQQPLQHQATALVEGSPAHAQQNQSGGIFVRRADQLTPEARALLLGAARVVLTASAGSLNKQLRSIWKTVEPIARTPPPAAPAGTAPARGELLFDNGLGGFSADGREYVLTVAAGALPPAPWCNVIANPQFGCVVTERGGGYTWAGNSQMHRLTPWSNDPVSDPVCDAVYLRDLESGALWSATPGPAGDASPYRVRHGQGYSVFEHTRAELEQTLEVFVSPKDPVKVSRLRLVNRGARPRRLAITGAIDWVMGTTRDASALSVVTQLDAATGAVLAQNPAGINPEARGFFCATTKPSSGTADREELFGRDGTRARPRGLERSPLSGRGGGGLDPCAALQVELELAPGETKELAFALGEARDLEQARALIADYSSLERVDAEWRAALASWNERLGRVEVKTPDPSLDLLINRWLPYQVLSARIWGRTGFYQSGGAYGFRDQLQDVLALLHCEPELVREHLLRAAARQFVEGDAQHWWHPESGEGVRTRCSDDMLWLPYAVAHYVSATGDARVLDEEVPWLEARALKPEEHDAMSTPAVSGARASLYQHCLKAIAKGNTRGPRGLPLIGAGDWNDGFNRVGQNGRGESVWLAWFIVRVLSDFVPLARARGDGETEQAFAAEARRLTEAIEIHAWDGEWYERATFDDGTALGSKKSSACRIDAIAQSWAVIAGSGDLVRAAQAVTSSERLLFDAKDAMMKLFTPPFEGGPPDPGYIAAYPPGVRENGGQYTHGVLWTALARVLLGDGDGALRLLSAFNPIHHASSPAQVARYAVEPYVMVADVYALDGATGRGGWTWYTGSAGWMYRVVLEHLLGVQLHEGKLRVSPTLPRGWKGFQLTYRGATHVVAAKTKR